MASAFPDGNEAATPKGALALQGREPLSNGSPDNTPGPATLAGDVKEPYDSDEEAGDTGTEEPDAPEDHGHHPDRRDLSPPTLLVQPASPRTPARHHLDAGGEIVHEPINSHRAHRISSRRHTERVESPTSIESRSTVSSSHARSAHPLASSSTSTHLFGTPHPPGTALGDKDTISLYLVTWNMHEQDFPLSLGPLLFADGSTTAVHQIYVVATQEGTMARRNWELKIQETLGPSYVIVHSAFLMGIHLCVVVHRDLTWDISYVESSTVATKMGGMLNTKGGVGIALHVRGNSFLFVDSHLAAHSKHTAQRNEDFHTIVRSLSFPRTAAIHIRLARVAAAVGGVGGGRQGSAMGPAGEGVGSVVGPSVGMAGAGLAVIAATGMAASKANANGGAERSRPLQSARSHSQSHSQSQSQSSNASDPLTPGTPAVYTSKNCLEMFDVIFWLGDLNYRIDMQRSTVVKAVGRAEWPVLRANDQLHKEQTAGRVFTGFHEGPIQFPPTFKYDLNCDEFDTSTKQRVPSWTDRILVRGSATCHQYSSIAALKVSDHRPVFAVYTAAAGQGRTLLPEECTVVDFDREALSECRRRHGQPREPVAPIRMAAIDSMGDRHRATFGDAVRYKSSAICAIS